jgi:taurine--2-oxoglutarate transaminase
MAFEADPKRGQEVLKLDRDHVFHSWSAQGTLNPMLIQGAEGSYVWDYDGKRYLDFSSQLVNTNVGHQHPKVIKAIQDQAGKLTTIAPQHANDMRGEAAKRIADLAPDGMNKVFFTNGGADAVENAIRMARIHTNKHKILSFYRSYHGNTTTAITATGDPRRWPNEFAMGHVHFFGPHLYRSSFWSETPEQESQRALAHLAEVIKYEGAKTIGAILLETVVGTAGILAPPPGYLEGVRKLCDENEILLILDEVMAGFGRTGEWFAFDNYKVKPDLFVFAKGSNSGYVPVGGVVIDDKIAKTFDERVFPGGLTYSGHPLAAASIVATIDVMKEEGIVENAKKIGKDILGPGLRELQERHKVIGEVRGLGTFWALDLVKNRETKEMIAPYGGTSPAMADLIAACKKNGLLPFVNYNRLHVVPPCNVSETEAKEGLAILDEVFASIGKYYEG